MSEQQAKETEIEVEVESEVAVDEVVETVKSGYSPKITLSDEVPDKAPEEAAEQTVEPAIKVEVTEEAIEIKVEEAGKPPARRLSRFDKRIKGKNAEIEAATEEVEALKEQVKLYQLRDQQAATVIEPDEDTFEGTSDELKAAQRQWNQSEIKRIASEEAQAIVEQTRQHTTQESQAQATEEINREHYKRADTLRVTNYDEL